MWVIGVCEDTCACTREGIMCRQVCKCLYLGLLLKLSFTEHLTAAI